MPKTKTATVPRMEVPLGVEPRSEVYKTPALPIELKNQRWWTTPELNRARRIASAAPHP